MELSLSSICLFNEYRLSHLMKYGQQNKIKKNIKLLHQQLCHYNLIKLKWVDFNYFQGIILVFSHGVISSICFDQNYSLISVSHDYFITNKLTSKRISNVEITKKFILISYVEPYLACIFLENNFKPNKIYTKFKLKSNCHVKQINLKKYVNQFSKRNLTVSEQYALIWWNRMSHQHNWTSDMAINEKNLIVFSFDDVSIIDMNPINGEILQAAFVAQESNKFGLLYKQKSSAYNLTYLLFKLISPEISDTNGMVHKDTTNKTTIKSLLEINIPMDKLCFSAEFTQTQDKILLLCDDESVILFNIEQNALYSLHSSIPICFISSYPLDSIFATCDHNGLISFYDNAFNNILHKTLPKIPSLGHKSICNNSNKTIKRLQFLSPKILIIMMMENRIHESSKSGNHLLSSLKANHRYNDATCCFKLIIFPYRITFKRLINEYLHLSKYEEALNVLRIINWNCSYEEAYLCLYTIFQHLIKLPFEQEVDKHIESTLASFLLPMTPIDYKIFEKILPFIRQLAIRFFYYLIRNGSLQKAYQLGIELKSPRLFLLLAELFKLNGLDELSTKSYEQAQNLLFSCHNYSI